MSNVIIIIILAAAIALGVRESVKHFKGEGGCCGGGSSYKPKKKKLEGAITHTYVLQVEDMHCQNCANTITYNKLLMEQYLTLKRKQSPFPATGMWMYR